MHSRCVAGRLAGQGGVPCRGYILASRTGNLGQDWRSARPTWGAQTSLHHAKEFRYVDEHDHVAVAVPLARGRCQSEEEAPRDGVVRLDLGAKPFDSRASSPPCERPEELAREAAMLPFVGHQDRNLGGGGSRSSRANRATPAMPPSSTAVMASLWPSARSSRRSRVLSVSTVTDP